MATDGKRIAQATASFDRMKLHHPAEAAELVKRMANAKFDETIDAAFRLGVDVRKADQIVRGTVTLPHGTGKSVRVAVFAEGEKAREAEAAGADIVGGADLVEKVQAGFLDFDQALATPDMMGQVGKLGRVLGPRGLMPNPKSGSVTQAIGQAVSDFKGGKIEYRTDRHGNVHVPIGKASFTPRQLLDNYAGVLDEILRAKPAAAKGRYLKSITLSSTMGPGIKVDPAVIRPTAADAEAEGKPEPVSA